MSSSEKIKSEYLPPKIELFVIELESTIAATSPRGIPAGDSGYRPEITIQEKEVQEASWVFED